MRRDRKASRDSRGDREDDVVLLDRASCQRGRAATLGRRLLAEAAEAIGASEATLWVISADGTHLEGALNHGKTPDVMESVSVPLGDSVVGMVAATGVGASVGPLEGYNRSVDARTKTTTVAMAATPVHVGGRLCGVLSAINPTRAPAFSREDLATLEWKGYLLGLVLADERDGR